MAIPQDTELSGKGTHFRMPLSTEQLLLLNNLMYMTAEEPLRSITAETYQGRTVRTMIESIDIKRFDEGKNYGSYMTDDTCANLCGYRCGRRRRCERAVYGTGA